MNLHPIERRRDLRLLAAQAGSGAAWPLPPARPAASAPVGDALGLRSTVDTLLQHRALASAVLGLVMLLALAFWFFATPQYKADTTLRIESSARNSLLPSLNGGDRGGMLPETPATSTEIETLMARELLLPVIQAVGLDIELSNARRWRYVPTGARHGVQFQLLNLPAALKGKALRLRVAQGRWFLADGKGLALAEGDVGQRTAFSVQGQAAELLLMAPPTLPETFFTLKQLQAVPAYDSVVKRLRMFEPARDSHVVRMSFEDASPTRAAALLNGLVEAYLQHTVRSRVEEGERAARYMQQQLPQLKARVETAEDALSAYRSRFGTVGVALDADALMRQRVDLERQLTELRIKSDLLSQTLTPAHPDLAAVLRQVATVGERLGQVGGAVNRLPAQQRDLVRLEREVQTTTQIYTSMLAQLQQVQVANATGQATARRISAAAVPLLPVRPELTAVLSVGAGVGLLAALLAVLLRHALMPTWRGAPEWQGQAVAPTLAVIPESAAQQRLMGGRLGRDFDDELGAHRVLARLEPRDPAVESLRAVKLGLQMRSRSVPTQVILVTAPAAGTGKAFVAANLATLLEEGGKRVLLIEADLRDPGLHHYLRLPLRAPGLTELLRQRRSLRQVTNSHAAIAIDVILAGAPTANPGALLHSEELAQVLTQLRGQYDHIVINAAPLMPSGDALAVGSLADLALMVVRAEHSLVQETQIAVRRLAQAGIPLEGLLLNAVKRGRMNAPVLT